MSEKIQPMHTEREAYVYIRQSSMQQVRTRLEGQRRQYDLRQRAVALGFQLVVVIDEDLGRSGTGSVERPGFGRLLTAVCSGSVGAVLALEASRLARNNRDWHHLIDLCAMAGTLVIDHDGVYDSSLLNDRLLLGLSCFRRRSTQIVARLPGRRWTRGSGRGGCNSSQERILRTAIRALTGNPKIALLHY